MTIPEIVALAGFAMNFIIAMAFFEIFIRDRNSNFVAARSLDP